VSVVIAVIAQQVGKNFGFGYQQSEEANTRDYLNSLKED
jgi:hypothetical protein